MKIKLIIILVFILSFQKKLYSQESCQTILLVVDGKIPTYVISGKLEFINNGNKTILECSYSLGHLKIKTDDTSSIEVLKSLPDTTVIHITLNYYCFKHRYNKYFDRIEQEYTFSMYKLNLFRGGYLIVAIKNNKDKTYELGLSSDISTTVNWCTKKMKKNRNIFR